MSQILTTPNKKIMGHIDTIIASTARSVRIPAKHQRDLPFAIRDLSRLLTEERGNLSRSYWAAPRFLSAYTYYFLPWNLYRLAFLLPNLNLSLQPESRILDMGSGPLTLPLALWCTRPELRSMPLHFVCSDIAQKPMEVGLDILKEADPETPWTFTLEKGSLEKVLMSHALPFDLIMGGNVLNELTPPKGMTLEDRIANISRLFPKKLTEESTVLLIEPGTRLGGKMLSLARKGALACGFEAVAPCTHSDPCPVLEQSAYYSQAPIFNGWCHFICDVDAAPETLNDLTRKAGFKRETLALSFLQMQWQGGETAGIDFGDSSFDLDDLESIYAESMGYGEDDLNDDVYETEQEESVQKNSYRGKIFQGHSFGEQRNSKEPIKKIKPLTPPCKARIISGNIRLASSTARYACSGAGLLLVTGARAASYGEQIIASWKNPIGRDNKTSSIMSTRVDIRKTTPKEKEDREAQPKDRGLKREDRNAKGKEHNVKNERYNAKRGDRDAQTNGRGVTREDRNAKGKEHNVKNEKYNAKRGDRDAQANGRGVKHEDRNAKGKEHNAKNERYNAKRKGDE